MIRILFLLLISSAAMGQGPGTFSAPFTIPNYYSAPGTPQISTFTPYDSTSGGYLHPCIIMAGGAGEVGNTNITGNTSAYYAKNNGATMRVRDTVRHIWVTYYIIWLYKGSDGDGNFNMKYFKNGYRYATTVMAGKIDPTRIYFSGLSLSGGAAADLVRDSVAWCSRFAAGSINDAVVGQFYVDNQTDITNNMNAAGLHVRFWWAEGDAQSTSPTFRDKMKFYYGATSGNTTRPNLMIVNGGSHGTGWAAASDTLHSSPSFNTTYTPSNANNVNTLEWYLNFQSVHTNTSPVSNAGSNQTITLPTASVTLNGTASYDPDGVITAYLWTRTSGPNTPTIVTSGGQSTSVTGLIAGTYVFNLRVTDDSSATANATVTITVNAAPTVNYQARVYKSFGADYATTSRNKPMKAFDSQLGGKLNANPKYGVTGDTTTAGNPAHGWNHTAFAPTKNFDQYGFGTTNKGVRYYVRDSIGSRCRVVYDLIGTKNPRDLSRKFKFTDIYGLDTSLAGLKIYFYNFDSIMVKPTASRWKYWARFDSLMRPMAILTNTGTSNWTSTGCLDSCRYVMVVITQNAFQYVANYNELVFYGAYNFDTSSTVYKDSLRSQYYTGSFPSKKNANYTFGETVGFNLFTSAGVNTRKSAGKRLRQYTNMSYLDTATTPGVHTSFWYQFETFPTLNNSTLATMKAEGHDVWFTNTGARTYNANAGQQFVNNDTLNQELEQPGIWRNESSALANLTRVLGRNTSGTNAFTTHPANGQNLATTMETGNETKIHGYSGLADYFRMKQDYDSIKAVDPTMIVRMPGAVEYSSSDITDIWFFANMFTDDYEIPFDRAQGHHYWETVDSLVTPNSFTEQVGSNHEAPEYAINSYNNQITYTDSTERTTWAYVQKPMDITETGGGATGTVSTLATVAGYDMNATPGRGIWDSAQYNSILNIRMLMQNMFSPIEQMVVYSLFDQVDHGGVRGPYLFWGNGLGGVQGAGAEMTAFYAGWYHFVSIHKRFKDYYPDAIILNGGRTGIWQYKCRSAINPDSVVYIVNYGTKTGSGSSTASINVGSISGNVERYVPSFTSVTGTSTTLTPSAGAVTLTVNEAPQFLFALETAAPTPPAGCPCQTLTLKKY